MLSRSTLLPFLSLAIACGSPALVSAQQSSPSSSPLSVPMQDKPPTLSLPLPAPSSAGSKASIPSEPVQGIPAPAPKAPSTTFIPNKPSSTTGQFVIHGADLQTRTWFGKQCDTIAEDLRRLLRDNQPWSIPIVVSIKTPPNISLTEPAVKANFAQLGEGGFHLQLTVQMRPDLNTNDLRSELIRMLIAERILRDHKELTTTRSRILPDWLLVGITEGLRYRERSRPSALFAAVFKSGKVYGIEEILGVSPGTLDAMSRTIYDSSSCALVLALVEQPDGGLRMGKFLNALASDNRSDRELINQWFPGIAQSKSSLDKWWSLQMANLARPTVFETLDPGETSKALDDALMLRFEVEAGSEPRPVATKESASSKEESKTDADEAETAKPRGLFSRLFSRSDDSDKPKEDKKPEPKKEKKTEPEPLSDEELAKTKRQGFRLRNLFGASSSDDKSAKKEDEAKSEKKKPEPKAEKPKDEKKPEPKKEKEAPKPEPKKEAPKPEPKPEPKKEEPKPEPKPEPKKETPKVEPKPEPKKEELKPEPKKEAPKKSEEPKKPEPKKEKEKPAEEPKSDAPKRKGFLSRIFSGSDDKEAPKTEDKPKDDKKAEPKSEKKPEPKPEAKKDDDKKSTSFVPDVFLRLAADLSFPLAANVAEVTAAMKTAAPHFTFLGFGKKKTDDKAKEEESSKSDKKKPTAKEDAKGDKKEPKKDDKKAEPEPKKTPAPAAKPAAKKMVLTSVPLEDYSKVQKRGDAKQIFAATVNELNGLGQRAHPLFRPIIADYILLINDIALGNTKEVTARLKAIKERRAEALKLAKAAQDHLDWFEASQSTKWSGTFDDYLRVPKVINDELPKRTDPVSQYLDDVEKAQEK